MAQRIPLVDYFVLDPAPHLVANECTHCHARFFDRRNACAACSGTEFVKATLPDEGEVTTFTIVAMGPPGVQTPYVAAVVNCGGTSVETNIVNCPADPDHVSLGMKVRLTSYPVGTDSTGVEAVCFGFEPR